MDGVLHTQHTPGDSATTPPDCTEGGYTTHVCAVCGVTYVADHTDALGHSYISVVTEPTCTDGGFTTHTCSVCGHSYKDAETEALGHNYDSVVTEPTCTEGGFTTHTCSVCGDNYVDAETEALGHDYDSVVTEPTCTDGGFTTHTCSVCGDNYVDAETEALGHHYDGGICSGCGTLAGVAYNTATGTSYATVAEALKAAQADQTVILLADCVEKTVLIYPGITLDLGGFDLTADYAVGFDTGHIIDSVGSGRLITASRNVVLDEENAMIPVYDGTGFAFTKVGFAIRRDTAYTGEGIKIQAIASPVSMAVVELLKDGAADNNLEVAIVLTWEDDQGISSQKFVLTDEVVAEVYSSNQGNWSSYSKRFSMVITGVESVANLKANIMLTSSTNTVYGGAEPVAIN